MKYLIIIEFIKHIYLCGGKFNVLYIKPTVTIQEIWATKHGSRLKTEEWAE